MSGCGKVAASFAAENLAPDIQWAIIKPLAVVAVMNILGYSMRKAIEPL
jgi:hypothetical protein